ncbi:MAG: hypothetical protein R2991_07770 [Thermoanaerobaculia bacterium]
MNLGAPHLHLMLNHLPVLAAPFALALGAIGWWRHQDVLMHAALATLVVVGASGWAAHWTGEEAEEVVEELDGVSHQRIHEHEEAAEGAMYGGLVVGALAAILLWAGRRRALHRGAVAVLLILTALLSGWLAYTANLGGEIRHPEIRPPGEKRGTG